MDDRAEKDLSPRPGRIRRSSQQNLRLHCWLPVDDRRNPGAPGAASSRDFAASRCGSPAGRTARRRANTAQAARTSKSAISGTALDIESLGRGCTEKRELMIRAVGGASASLRPSPLDRHTAIHSLGGTVTFPVPEWDASCLSVSESDGRWMGRHTPPHGGDVRSADQDRGRRGSCPQRSCRRGT